jgi:hypothetical protein
MNKSVWIVVLGALMVLTGISLFVHEHRELGRFFMIAGDGVELIGGIELVRGFRIRRMDW